MKSSGKFVFYSFGLLFHFINVYALHTQNIAFEDITFMRLKVRLIFFLKDCVVTLRIE